MKITIEPSSDCPHLPGTPKVSFDTLTNEDLTPELVEACLHLCIALGHSPGNVWKAAVNIGQDNLDAEKLTED